MKFTKGESICREDLAYPEGALVCDGYDHAGGGRRRRRKLPPVALGGVGPCGRPGQ